MELFEEYKDEDWGAFVYNLMKRYIDTEHCVVRIDPATGKWLEVKIFENEIKSKEDTEKPQQKVVIKIPKRARVVQREYKGLKRMADDVITANPIIYANFKVCLTPENYKRLGENEYIVKLFDKYFHIKVREGIKCDGDYCWLMVADLSKVKKPDITHAIEKSEIIISISQL